jgi:14-3-3 protein epsilon
MPASPTSDSDAEKNEEEKAKKIAAVSDAPKLPPAQLIEDRTFMARLAEQACCFDDMIDFLSELLEEKTNDFTIEERNLYSVAFKNYVDTERQSIKMLTDIAEFERFSRFQRCLVIYKSKLEKSLSKKCALIVQIIEKKCLPLVENSESNVFWLKMIGDFYRYQNESLYDQKLLAEELVNQKLSQNERASRNNILMSSSVGSLGIGAAKARHLRKQANDNCEHHYKLALQIACKDLSVCNPIRLGLALNFAVSYYEMHQNPDKALALAETTITQAMEKIDDCSENQFSEATTILDMIQENIKIWSDEQAKKQREAELAKLQE